MGIVKLALAGLDGVKESEVRIGSATVVYDANALTAARVVETVNGDTPFHAELSADEPLPAPGAG